MKQTIIRPAVMAGMLTLGTGLVWAQAQAQGQTQPQTKQKKLECPTQAQAKKRSSKLRQVSGTVLQTKLVEVKGTNTQNLVALIKTTKNDRRLLVDLGPQNGMPSSVVPGERIAAEGVVVRLGDHQVLVANRVRDDDKVHQIKRVEQIRQMKRG